MAREKFQQLTTLVRNRHRYVLINISRVIESLKLYSPLPFLDIFDAVLMSYARLSRRPLLFKPFNELERFCMASLLSK
jgi:hypothetical protein